MRSSGNAAHEPVTSSPAVVFEHVSFAFDDHVVLRDVSFEVPDASMRIILGASGAGKSIILKLTLGLLRPDGGRIFVHGSRIDNMREQDLLRLRGDIGMLFQESALFDSLTVGENVGYRLAQEMKMADVAVRQRVEELLGFMGLQEHIDRLPSELSGGQRRRVAIARAMAARPTLLLLDDPTTGLDPIVATTVDDEIVKLRDLEHVTAIVVTHQIRDAFYVATHTATPSHGLAQILPAADGAEPFADFIVLHDGHIRFEGTGDQLLASADPYLKELLFMTLPPW
jgi:phospholipid/cholesterol/gamma-HCH transport system ATP-binding protein